MGRDDPAQGCRKLEAVVGIAGERTPRRGAVGDSVDDRWTVGAVFVGIYVGEGILSLGIGPNPLIYHGSAIADRGRIYLPLRSPLKSLQRSNTPGSGRTRSSSGSWSARTSCAGLPFLLSRLVR